MKNFHYNLTKKLLRTGECETFILLNNKKEICAQEYKQVQFINIVSHH